MWKLNVAPLISKIGLQDEVEPRKGMIVSYIAAEVLFSPSLGGIYTAQQEGYRKMHSALTEWVPVSTHLIPTTA